MSETRELAETIRAARTRLAAAEAQLAALCLSFADARRAEDAAEPAPRSAAAGANGVQRPAPGAFAVDELSCLLGEACWDVSRLVARTRRTHRSLPQVGAAALSGQINAERIRLIDQAARQIRDQHTLTTLDDEAVQAAIERTPRALKTWLHRFLARHEPDALSHRRQVRFADRRVSIAQSITGIGYVTGEVCAEDAASIDARLTDLAWAIGNHDPRTQQQRRSDLFAGLLLGTVSVGDGFRGTNDPAAKPATNEENDTHDGNDTQDGNDDTSDSGDYTSDGGDENGGDDRVGVPGDVGLPGDAGNVGLPGDAGNVGLPGDAGNVGLPGDAGNVGLPGDAGNVGLPGDATRTTAATESGFLEVEQIDPDTGEYLGTHRVLTDPEGNPIEAAPADLSTSPNLADSRTLIGEATRRLRIGIVIPLSSLIGQDDTPGELSDRSAMIPADIVRSLAGSPDISFTRLLVDDGGRLLDTRELGPRPSRRLAEAIRIRNGSCTYPTCSIPANHCDLDHHQPLPHGPTEAGNLDPLCRRHHRGKTFAGLAAHRDHATVTWTLPTADTYRCTDEPLPMPLE